MINYTAGLEDMGRRRDNQLPRIVLYMLILAILAGCAPAHFRTHPQLQEKVQGIKTVAIMPPGIKVYRLDVGGGTEFMDERTETAKQTVATAIEKELGRHAGVVVKTFPSPPAILDTTSNLKAAELKAELEDTQALFEAVSSSVRLHAYTPASGNADQRFPEKLKNFDYSLGPEVERLAKLANADALLFISGVGHVPTGGRATLMVLMGILGFLGGPGVPPGALTFEAGQWGAPHGFSVALVDGKTGALLWYNVDFLTPWTYPESAIFLAERVFENFPVGENPPTRSELERSGWPGGPGPR